MSLSTQDLLKVSSFFFCCSVWACSCFLQPRIMSLLLLLYFPSRYSITYGKIMKKNILQRRLASVWQLMSWGTYSEKHPCNWVDMETDAQHGTGVPACSTSSGGCRFTATGPSIAALWFSCVLQTRVRIFQQPTESVCALGLFTWTLPIFPHLNIYLILKRCLPASILPYSKRTQVCERLRCWILTMGSSRVLFSPKDLDFSAWSSITEG